MTLTGAGPNGVIGTEIVARAAPDARGGGDASEKEDRDDPAEGAHNRCRTGRFHNN